MIFFPTAPLGKPKALNSKLSFEFDGLGSIGYKHIPHWFKMHRRHVLDASLNLIEAAATALIQM